MKDVIESRNSLVPGGCQIIPYPIEQFKVREAILTLLKEKNYIQHDVPLEDIHKYIPLDAQKPDDYIINKVITDFYDTNEEFQAAYFKFVKYVAEEIVKKDVIFQTTPTIRFHFPLTSGNKLNAKYRAPNGKAILHHIDSMQGHPFEEINCWVPLSDCYGSNALQLGSLEDSIKILSDLTQEFNYDPDIYFKEGKALFHKKLMSDSEYLNFVLEKTKPVDMKFGELLLFDSRCIHGPDENIEKHTRVSFDFRMIPLDAYEKFTRTYQSSGRTVRKFARGDVFHEKSVSELVI